MAFPIDKTNDEQSTELAAAAIAVRG